MLLLLYNVLAREYFKQFDHLHDSCSPARKGARTWRRGFRTSCAPCRLCVMRAEARRLGDRNQAGVRVTTTRPRDNPLHVHAERQGRRAYAPSTCRRGRCPAGSARDVRENKACLSGIFRRHTRLQITPLSDPQGCLSLNLLTTLSRPAERWCYHRATPSTTGTSA